MFLQGQGLALGDLGENCRPPSSVVGKGGGASIARTENACLIRKVSPVGCVWIVAMLV